MKKTCILFLVLLSSIGYSNPLITIRIDTQLCTDCLPLDGTLGIYETLEPNQRGDSFKDKDSLVKQLKLVKNQIIKLDETYNLHQLNIKYTPRDSNLRVMKTPLVGYHNKNNTITLNCYSLRQPIPLLDQLAENDTLTITSEYCGNSHAGMAFSRTCVRIMKQESDFYYAINKLPVRGDLYIPTFPVGGYEAGFSPLRKLTAEKLAQFRIYEQLLPNMVGYMNDFAITHTVIAFNDEILSFRNYTYYNDLRLNQITSLFE